MIMPAGSATSPTPHDFMPAFQADLMRMWPISHGTPENDDPHRY